MSRGTLPFPTSILIGDVVEQLHEYFLKQKAWTLDAFLKASIAVWLESQDEVTVEQFWQHYYR